MYSATTVTLAANTQIQYTYSLHSAVNATTAT